MTQSTSAQAKVSDKVETAVSTLGFIPGDYTGDVPVDHEAILRAPLSELRGFLGECGLLADQPAGEEAKR